jgi:hypothetical protein
MTSQPDDVASLALAFPASVRQRIPAVLEILPPTRLMPASPFTVSVQGESVTIPYRLYNDEPESEAQQTLSPDQRAILHCLYTRHHDGRIRHQHLEQVSRSLQSWVMPFVVQLVGEYVLEILVTIQDQLSELNTPGGAHHTAYGQFLAANHDFLTLTGQRMTSYWNCYYRSTYPELHTYPGHALLRSLRAAASSYAATT